VQEPAGKIEEPLSAEGWEMLKPAGKIKEPLSADRWEMLKPAGKIEEPLRAIAGNTRKTRSTLCALR